MFSCRFLQVGRCSGASGAGSGCYDDGRANALNEVTNTPIVTGEMRLLYRREPAPVDGQQRNGESPSQAGSGSVSRVCTPYCTAHDGEWRRRWEKAWGWPVSRLLAACTAEAMPKAAPAQTRICDHSDHSDHSDHTINRELSLQVLRVPIVCAIYLSSSSLLLVVSRQLGISAQ